MSAESSRQAGFLQRLRADWEERRFAREVARKGGWYAPLHGDPVLQGLVDEIIQDCGVTLFVETGTFVGDTTKFVAQRHPKLRVLTCELNPRWLQLAQRFCQGVDNIEFFGGQSPSFLRQHRSELESNRTLFWLDAHWGPYWPLLDETRVIATLPRYVAFIDDFEVPGRESFHFDSYNGAKNCIDLHKAVLGPVCFVPDYDPDLSCRSPAGYGLYLKGVERARIATMGRLRELSANQVGQRVAG